jgi:molecular chaperone Hsp33
VITVVPPATDCLSRFVFEHAAIRGALVSLDDSCSDILACHPYPPALRRALAELLAAATLLASTLKFNGTLTVQLQGEGAVRLLVVECTAELVLRATAQWSPAAALMPANASLAKLAEGPEPGRLAITLDPRDGGPIYQGIVGLEAVSIAELIEHYLSTSEQIASRILLAAADGRVRGLLLQRLPDAARFDEKAWQAAAMRIDTISPADLLAGSAVTPLLSRLFPEDDLRLFSPQPTRFACRCSVERVAGALRLIGQAEVESILDEQGSVSIHCEFCNRRYAFDADEARAVFGGDDAGAAHLPLPTRH